RRSTGDADRPAPVNLCNLRSDRAGRPRCPGGEDRFVWLDLPYVKHAEVRGQSRSAKHTHVAWKGEGGREPRDAGNGRRVDHGVVLPPERTEDNLTRPKLRARGLGDLTDGASPHDRTHLLRRHVTGTLAQERAHRRVKRDVEHANQNLSVVQVADWFFVIAEIRHLDHAGGPAGQAPLSIDERHTRTP